MNGLKLWWLGFRVNRSHKRWRDTYWLWTRGLVHKTHLDQAAAHLEQMIKRHAQAKEQACDTP